MCLSVGVYAGLNVCRVQKRTLDCPRPLGTQGGYQQPDVSPLEEQQAPSAAKLSFQP